MRISKLKLVVLVVMSAFGLWASSEVVIVYYTLNQELPFCPSGNLPFGLRLDCGAVLGSKYSAVFGVPLEFFAVAYFIINLALVYTIAFGSDRAYKTALRSLFAWRFIGLLIVPYLLFVELFLLKAICIYCTIMHVAIVTDFVVISYLLFFGKNSLWGGEEALPLEEAEQGPSLQTRS
jgi:uncharacterized membrane protein